MDVLLIDDAPEFRLLLRSIFEQAGHSVREAVDGQAGVDAAANCPDMILLDLAMPVMDGFEALPLLREACPDTSITVLTGFMTDVVEERALGLGADRVLEKGISLTELVALAAT